ncbi:magnesium and cobalt transport protein CorA [Thalassolituus oleivorans]|uniref:magnesium/cobalt transporter CorA n=1 Tax=Thalassolituus oleivorans TaxID=187493 RepID=UPI0009492C1D|nr:magnesium/cobalt transporter CorA [Thalassolituus oleivorans]APR67930.1 magnesium and cobalt transport protein CorA [Thalassolituus oleivorans]
MTSLRKPSDKLGMRPGSLIHVGDRHHDDSLITVVDYTPDEITTITATMAEEIFAYRERKSVTWVVIEGLTDVSLIEKIGAEFGIHQLVLEDILNTHQRPKFEEYDDYLYIVLKCLVPAESDEFSVEYEQISLIVLNDYVFTFKEKRDALFDPIQVRLNSSKGRFRNLGADYLTYAILDTVVDQNFVVIDSLDDAINDIEDQLLDSQSNKETLNTIQRLKREIITMRRQVAPVRELLAAMLRSETKLIDTQTHIFLRDVADHSMRIVDSIESYRDILTGLLDVYISSVSNKMNEVMKVLTIFASIFIPLTFFAGIYGMNFEYMPELKWKWGYPALWGVFLLITAGLLVFFRRKKWL